MAEDLSGAVIGSLKVLIGGDATGLIEAAAKSKEALGELRAEEEISTAAIQTFGAAILAAGAAFAGEFIHGAMEAINAHYLLAQQIGGTTQAIQVMDRAAEMSGVSADSLEAAARRLNATLGEVEKKGAGPAYEALQRLGLSAQELSRMDLDKRFLAIAQQMDKLGYTTQQEAAFLKDMGLRGGTVVGVLRDAGSAITEAADQVDRFGIAVSEIDAAKVHQAKEAFDELNLILQGIANQVVVALSPYVIALGQNLEDVGAKGPGLESALGGALHDIGADVAQVRDAVQQLGTAIEYVEGLALNLTTVWDHSSEKAAQVDELYKKINEDMAKPLPSTEFEKWYKGVTTGLGTTKDAAVGLREQLDQLVSGGPTDAQIKAGAKAADALQKQLDSELKSLQTSLQASVFSEDQSYHQRLTELQTFLAKKMVTQQQYDDLFTRLEADHAKKLQAVQQQEYQDESKAQTETLNMVVGTLDAIGNAIQGAGETGFAIAKGFSVATALLKGYEAITSSYAAGAAIGGPVLGGIFAGLAAAATAAQIASIMSVTSSSSGTPTVSGGSSSSASQAAAAAPAANTSHTLTLQGISADQLYSGGAVRSLVQQLIQYQKDGGTLVYMK